MCRTGQKGKKVSKDLSCIIIQSNYIPWKGYFDGISKADVFVVYDDMQYTKQDWRNRNLIKTFQGLKWITIPVNGSGKFGQKINETSIAKSSWINSHLDIIKANYSKAPFFKEVWPWLEELYRTADFTFLTEVNLHFISGIMKVLQISTDVRLSSDFRLEGEKTERLVNLCLEMGIKKYLSGPAAKAYLDESLFQNQNIEVEYLDYSAYPEYSQLFPPFEHGVSILDMFLNLGFEGTKMKMKCVS